MEPSTSKLFVRTKELKYENNNPLSLLTICQHDVLRLLARGGTNRELAEILVIQLATVENHLVKIYRKLDVRNRTEAVILAFSCGLVDEEDKEEEED